MLHDVSQNMSGKELSSKLFLSEYLGCWNILDHLMAGFLAMINGFFSFSVIQIYTVLEQNLATRCFDKYW